MSALERYVILANSIMAAMACVVNAQTARFSPEPWRSVRIPIAALAGLYSAAYGWLFITESLSTWSSVMRGVSILSWPIVWIRPALTNRKLVRELDLAITSAQETTDE